jgi:hypothetical protein
MYCLHSVVSRGCANTLMPVISKKDSRKDFIMMGLLGFESVYF